MLETQLPPRQSRPAREGGRDFRKESCYLKTFIGDHPCHRLDSAERAWKSRALCEDTVARRGNTSQK